LWLKTKSIHKVIFDASNPGTFNSNVIISSDDDDDPTREILLSGEGFSFTNAEPDICYASTGNIDGGRLISINLSNGSGTLITNTSLFAIPALAIDSEGRIYGTQANDGTLFRIDASTGLALEIGFLEYFQVAALAFDKNDLMYGFGFEPQTFNPVLFSYDLASKISTTIYKSC